MHDSGSVFDAGLGAGGDFDIERELFFAMEEETSGLGPPHLDVDRIHRSGRRRTAVLAGSAAAVVAVGVGAAVALSSSGGSGTGGAVADRTPVGVTATSASAAAAAGSVSGTPGSPGSPTPSGAAKPVPVPVKTVLCMTYEVISGGPNSKVRIMPPGTTLAPSAVIVHPPAPPGGLPSAPGRQCVAYMVSVPSEFPSDAKGSAGVVYMVSPVPSGMVSYVTPTPTSSSR